MLKTYFGSCHCGDVTFAAEIDLAEGSGRCNCSICTKRRAWSVIVKPEDFRLLRGADKLSDYQFGTRSGHHRFCSRCGCAPFGDGHIEEIGGDYVSIAVACLDEVTPEELAAVPVRYSDGRNNAWWDEPREMAYL
ncbi:GFA family protein [Sphingobium nicotianae]|uniref:GFA family protein n=1 Tax=Sphingobium nicotianae TaxID=2782607 RepID=A0A9X1DDG0_9SPHN|nr:GFA family protein [Sphingobium nicotianae]MBT2187473.1 GFA family protein [Sphingobium nicotianae]